MELTEHERRREIALAGLDAFIDVTSAWRGRYEDDDRLVTVDWLLELIPQQQDDPPRGWLCVRDTATPALGWEYSRGVVRVLSLCKAFDGRSGPHTRKRFREVARKNNVSLPVAHATLYLKEEWPISERPKPDGVLMIVLRCTGCGERIGPMMSESAAILQGHPRWPNKPDCCAVEQREYEAVDGYMVPYRS